MIKIGLVLVMAVILISIGVAITFYVEYQPKFITANAGEQIQVGPVKYSVIHTGEHNGTKDIRPENTFFQIQIIAENASIESTRMYGGQFYVLDDSGNKFQAVYGNFSDKDLYEDFLEPNVPVTWTTQFDIPFDPNMKYRIGILPSKVQSSIDIGMICVTNC